MHTLFAGSQYTDYRHTDAYPPSTDSVPSAILAASILLDYWQQKWQEDEPSSINRLN